MATLAITGEETKEVRMQVGTWVKEDVLTDAQIQSKTVLGTASDYVFEKIRNGMNLDAFSAADRLIAERFYDETDDDIVNFVEQVLKPPQREQMRRAVIYYSAGLCVPIVPKQIREGAIGVTTEVELLQTQQNLFDLADEQIDNLRNAFPTDAFKKKIPKINMFTTGKVR